LKDVKNKKYIIKSGTYSGIILKNIQNTTIESQNNVKIIGGGILIENSDSLTIKGISIEDYNQAGISIRTSVNNLILEDINLKNIANYGIKSFIKNKYDGTSKSYSKNIQLINIKAENVGNTLFISEGDFNEDGFYG